MNKMTQNDVRRKENDRLHSLRKSSRIVTDKSVILYINVHTKHDSSDRVVLFIFHHLSSSEPNHVDEAISESQEQCSETE